MEAVLAWLIAAKRSLETSIALGPDALHVHLGLAIFLSARLVLGSAGRALLVVIALEGLNECVDLAHAGFSAKAWMESKKDVLGTLFWPCLLALLWRKKPGG